MKGKFLFLILLYSCIFNNINSQESEVCIKWLGHACFLITASGGTQILMDPVEFKGYHMPQGIEPDIVTISHNHPDHNRIDVIAGHPVLLEGTDKSIPKVVPIDTTIHDVRIFTVPSYHSPGKFGMNAIFVIELEGIRIAHLGDLGTILTDDQIQAIGVVDILMIPVGGQFTISGSEADTVVNQLQVSNLVFPMHYKTDAFIDLPYSAEDYLSGKDNVIRISGNTCRIDLFSRPEDRQYVVLDY